MTGPQEVPGDEEQHTPEGLTTHPGDGIQRGNWLFSQAVTGIRNRWAKASISLAS